MILFPEEYAKLTDAHKTALYDDGKEARGSHLPGIFMQQLQHLLTR
jgi:hypothetical protein